MRAVLYARVSSSKQRDQHTIESQMRDGPAYIAAMGWHFAGSYVDDGRSAKTGALELRDAYARLVADARAGRFDVVVVVAVDRLTRSEDPVERTMTVAALTSAGVKLAVVGAGVQDPSTFAGDAYITLQSLFAAEENRRRRERTVAGKLTAISRGRKPSGWTPYGYRYDRATGAWSVYEPEAAVVREIYARVIGGESCETIAISLTDRGIPRPKAPTWLREYVQFIARRRTYVGEWRADRQRALTIAIPPIVSEETWSQAQDALTRHGKRGLRQTRHVYLLEEIALCSICGAMIGIASAIGDRAPSKYICCRRRRPAYGRDRCELDLHRTRDVDAQVWPAVAEALADRARIRQALDLLRARTRDRSTWEADHARVRADLARLDRAEAAILARFRREQISEVAMDTELAAIARERASLRRQEAHAARAGRSASGAAGAVLEVEDALTRLREAVGKVTRPEDQRTIVRAVVGKGGAVVEPDAVTVDVHVPSASACGSAWWMSYRPIVARARILVRREA